MISFISVTCPHCGISGQIVMPPAGSVIVGPCPRCGKPVVLFHGWVLPLESQVMDSGNTADIRQHVKDVLHKFIIERVDHLFDHVEAERRNKESAQATSDAETEASESPDEEPNEQRPENYEPFRRFIASELRKRMSMDNRGRRSGKITDQEVQQFVQEELNKIDDNDYFRSIFG
ncbi:MAG TPA: hypothetical protein PK349_11365 [Candidatus Hydrogenedentes bacterium]|nr:hypothetical protein [Candidatus Hydrogenedentota bacterium]